MADIAPTISQMQGHNERRCHMVLWETLTSANAAGTAVQMGGSTDRTVQIIGTFDSATVVMQGSMDGTTWFTLTDPQGNAISKTAAAGEAITEITRYIRPSTSGGGASQDIDVYLFMVKS